MSMVILQENLYGYYIHAKAPWHASDIPLDWLQVELQREGDGDKRMDRRALKAAPASTPGSQAIQSYQVYVNPQLREELVRTKSEVVPVSVLGEPEKVRAMGDGKKKRRGRRSGIHQDDDDNEPLTSHERRAKN